MRKGTSLTRDLNLEQVRAVVRRYGKISKPQLAQETGLSVVTANALMKILLERGEVVEDAAEPSSGGRPAAVYRFNAVHVLALTVSMHEEDGIDTAFFSVIDLYGREIASAKLTVPDITVGTFDETIEDLIAWHAAIRVMVFGMPGREVRGRLFASDYEKLRGQSFSARMREKFGLPVVFENDLNAAVAGYCHQNEIARDACVIGVYCPEKYPPGAGIFLHGRIYKGRDGSAGELLYLPTELDWARLAAGAPEREMYLAQLMMTFISLYNPDRIVLYGDGFSSALAARLVSLCAARIPRALLPEVEISNEFGENFAVGLARIALRRLERGAAAIRENGEDF